MGAHNGTELFIVEGTIEAMRVAPGVVNLMKDIQSGAFWSGAAAGLTGEAGVAANCANLLMYDGEDVEHVAILINGRLAIGTFEWLRDLMVHDEVKLVVSDTDEGPLFVHAILRKNDHLLWTPFSIDHTRRGWMLHGFKLGFLGLFLTFLILGSFYVFDRGSRPSGGWLLFIVLATIALIGFVGFMSTRGVMDLGEYAENIFRALDVPKFERFRIKPYSIFNLHSESAPDAVKKGHIFQFADALAAHKKRFHLS
jgi:hypothetical protein